MLEIKEFLLKTYIRVLKINLETERYDEIDLIEELAIPHKSFSKFYYDFAAHKVHPADRLEFLKLVDVYDNLSYFEDSSHKYKAAYYRCKVADSWQWVIGEVRRYGNENNVILFTSQLVENESAVQDALINIIYKFQSAEMFRNKIEEYRKTFPASLSVIIIKTLDPKIEEILKRHYNVEDSYYHDDPNVRIIMLEGLGTTEFKKTLLMLFEDLNELNDDDYKIGTCWCDDETKGVSYVLRHAFDKLQGRE